MMRVASEVNLPANPGILRKSRDVRVLRLWQCDKCKRAELSQEKPSTMSASFLGCCEPCRRCGKTREESAHWHPWTNLGDHNFEIERRRR